MKRNIYALVIFSFLCFTMFSTAFADIDWSELKDVNISDKPLDIAFSQDGKLLFILTKGTIHVYSAVMDKIDGTIPVNPKFTKIAFSSTNNAIALSGKSLDIVKIINFDQVYDIDVSDLYYYGPEDASVTIAVFADYQCPYCQKLKPLLNDLLKKYPKDVKVVFKNYPLPSHKMARPAAIASLAAHRQGKFKEYDEQLISNSRALNEAKLTEIATSLGLNIGQFQKDRKDPELEKIIQRDMKEGMNLDVRGVPAVFINGKMLKNRSNQGFDMEIKRILEK